MDVVSSSACILKYRANPSGGVQPYNYFWHTTGTITEESGDVVFLTFADAGAHQVTLQTVDANGAEVWHTLEIIASSSGMECYNY